MTTSSSSFCFVCAHSVTKGDSPPKRKRKRNDSNERNEFVGFNQAHRFLLKLLLSPTSSPGLREDEEAFPRNSTTLLVEELVELQRLGRERNNNSIQLCGRCDILARECRDLYLELEVVQMKLVDKLRCARESVVTRNCDSLLGRGGDGVKIEHEQDEMVSNLLNIFDRFQSFVKEHDVIGEHIPLVYLRRLQRPLLTSEKEALCDESTESINGGVVKQELQDDWEDYVDDSIASSNYDNGNCSSNDAIHVDVKTELPQKQRKAAVRKKPTCSKKNKSSRAHRSKEISPPLILGRRRAAEGASNLKISTKPLPPKLLPEAKLLSPKLQKAEKQIRLGKSKLGERKQRQRSIIYTCEICSFKTIYRGTFEQHLRTHEVEPEGSTDKTHAFQCPDCKQGFFQNQYYEFHLKMHMKSIRVKCEICDELVLPVDLKEHYTNSHGKAYPCKHCTHCFGSISGLAYHSKQHTGVGLTCEECTPPTILKGMKSFLRHLLDVHNHEELLVSCKYPNCSEKILQCDKFVHMIKHEQNHECTYCGKRFATKGNLQNHIMSVHETFNRPYECDLCGKKFVFKDHLENHKVAKHNFPSKYTCELCPGKQFAGIRCLDAHRLRVHNSGKPHACPEEGCGKRFWTTVELKNHLLRHGSERQFTCEVCGFSMKTKKGLKAHSLVHSDVKQHVCPHCGKRFRLGATLRDHIRIHTGERPFLCAVCGASFNQMASLCLHRRKQHHNYAGSGLPLNNEAPILDEEKPAPENVIITPKCGS